MLKVRALSFAFPAFLSCCHTIGSTFLLPTFLGIGEGQPHLVWTPSNNEQRIKRYPACHWVFSTRGFGCDNGSADGKTKKREGKESSLPDKDAAASSPVSFAYI
jgi:hypothetical protein